MLNQLLKEIQAKANPERAKHSQRFFKTGKGEYGEGDFFLGLTMPQQREIAKKYTNLSFSQINQLLDSTIHEHRMQAGIILTKKAKQKPEETFNFYIKNAKKFNNWDLVDITCNHTVGKFLLDKPKQRAILYNLAKSKNLWEKRIAIISTGIFISKGDFGDTLKISETLLKDKHDLIHKAIGWMLREVGKRDKKVLEDFLRTNYKSIPRTTLRYAIERFPEGERKKLLKGKFK